MEATVLGGTTWLLVSRDLAWADGVARALRALGAAVRLLDVEGEGIARLADADSQVLVLTEAGPSSSLQAALEAHPGLRGAATVTLNAERVWPRDRSTPDLEQLMRLCGPALERDRDVRARVGRGEQITLELRELSLVRLLRTLADLPGNFVVQLSPFEADAYVAMSDGHWIGASYRPKERGAQRLDGQAALRRALELREASCLVLPAAKLSVPAWKQPLDAALADALAALHAERDGELPEEPTRPSGNLATHPTGRSTAPAQTLGPLESRRRSQAPRWHARRSTMLVAAAGAGFGAMALLTLLLEQEPGELGSVEPRAQPPIAAAPPPAASVAELRVEPLQGEAPRAPRAPNAETVTGSAAGSARPADEDAAAQTQQPEPEPAPEDVNDDRDKSDGEDDPNARGSWHRSRRLSRAGRRAESAEPARARELYERALENDPRNPHAVVGMARLERQAGDLDDAARLMERATALRSRRDSYRLLQGHILLEAGRPAEALEAFEIARKLEPGSRAAARGMRRARAALGD